MPALAHKGASQSCALPQACRPVGLLRSRVLAGVSLQHQNQSPEWERVEPSPEPQRGEPGPAAEGGFQGRDRSKAPLGGVFQI